MLPNVAKCWTGLVGELALGPGIAKRLQVVNITQPEWGVVEAAWVAQMLGRNFHSSYR
jgi:hypothetical protein